MGKSNPIDGVRGATPDKVALRQCPKGHEHKRGRDCFCVGKSKESFLEEVALRWGLEYGSLVKTQSWVKHFPVAVTEEAKEGMQEGKSQQLVSAPAAEISSVATRPPGPAGEAVKRSSVQMKLTEHM